MKVLKSILIFILALIITILICLVYITNLLNNTVLSKDYVLSKLDETDYYNQISIYIESNFEKYINQSGLDDDVVKNLITIENVKENTQKILNNMYDETQETINNEVLEQNLRNNIENYLNKNNLTASQADIDAFVETISNEYLSSISHNKYEKKIYNVISTTENTLSKIKKIAIIGLIVTILLLAILNIKEIHNFFAKIGVSILSSGLLLIFTNVFVNRKIDVKNLLILNEAISHTLKSIVLDILTKISKNGLVFIILGLILIVVSSYVKNLLKKDVEEKNKI